MFRKKQSNCVEVKVVTWDKDSHGLFDYESKCFTQKYYHIDASCLLLQNQQDKELEWTQQDTHKQLTDLTKHTCLGRLTVNHNIDHYDFQCCEHSDRHRNHHQPYLVVRSLKNEKGQQKGYTLQLGDVIKFGRLEYCVLEYRDDKRTYSNGLFSSKTGVHNADKTLHGACRICLSDDQDEDNFLLAPCDCSGSCSLVHIDCLRRWIQHKVHTEVRGVVEFNFGKFDCQICKAPIPETVLRKGREHNMLVICKPNEPYLILEALSQKKIHKNIFLMTFGKDGKSSVKLGRGHQCQMRMVDISVSRVHAQIAYRSGKFAITDNSSKFGTLVKINGKHKLSDERCAIQIGKTVIICAVKPTHLLKFRKETEPHTTEPQPTLNKA